MSTPPTAAQLVAMTSWGEWQTYSQALVNAVKEMPGGGAQESKTIASGAITPTVSLVQIDTESAATSDDLDTILQTNHPAGRLLVVRSADASRVVVLKHGTGNLSNRDSLDIALIAPEDFVVYVRVSTSWVEVYRSMANRAGRVIEVTEVAASPRVLVESDSGAFIRSDPAAAARNYATLPPAVAGLRFPFGSDSAQGLRLTADGTDTIQRHASTSGGGGYYETPAEDGFQGELLCWKNGQWVVRFEQGSGSGSVT